MTKFKTKNNNFCLEMIAPSSGGKNSITPKSHHTSIDQMLCPNHLLAICIIIYTI